MYETQKIQPRKEIYFKSHELKIIGFLTVPHRASQFPTVPHSSCGRLGGLCLASLPHRSSCSGKPRLSYLRLGRGDIAEAAAGRYESCEGRGTQVKTRLAP